MVGKAVLLVSPSAPLFKVNITKAMGGVTGLSERIPLKISLPTSLQGWPGPHLKVTEQEMSNLHIGQLYEIGPDNIRLFLKSGLIVR